MSDHVKQLKGQLFRANRVNMNPLYDALCTEAFPCRVTPQNPPDHLARMVWGG
jgi:hypothetical protein